MSLSWTAFLAMLLLVSTRPAASAANEGAASFYPGIRAGELTAAHRSLPFGTRVRVTRLGTGRSVIVRINDRGPFIAGRIIDVSRRAAEELQMISAGVTRVKVEVVGGAAPQREAATFIKRKKSFARERQATRSARHKAE